MQEFGQIHRLFLHRLLLRPTISTQKALEDYEKLHQSLDIPQIPFSVDFISTLNSQLENIEMTIKMIVDPHTGQEHYVLINIVGDELAQIATEYSASEIQYFKLIINEIMNSKNFRYSSTDALIQATKLKLSKANAEAFLEKLCIDGWLSESKGKLQIGIRTRAELELYLTNEFENLVMDCRICNDMILSESYTCKNEECETIAHVRCVQKFSNGQDQKCHNCGKDLGGNIPKKHKKNLEKEVEDQQSTDESNQTDEIEKGSRKRRARQ